MIGRLAAALGLAAAAMGEQRAEIARGGKRSPLRLAPTFGAGRFTVPSTRMSQKKRRLNARRAK